MRWVTSILFAVVGTALRFAASAQMAGFKMHALGATLMVIGLTAFVGMVSARASWVAARRSQTRDEADRALLGV